MIAVLIFGTLIVVAAVAVFVWTAVRSAVRQAIENAQRDSITAAPVAWFDRIGADADPRAADRAASVHIGYPVDHQN